MAKVKFKYRVPAGLPGSYSTDEREDVARAQDASAPEKVDRWWYESSYDLRSGLEVSDNYDTVPGDLLDELFKR
ncbi:MAG TPA: hypothetical protein VJM48_09670 [Methylibium sp.]|nr:hypothetical protein [Methylibium sp.]